MGEPWKQSDVRLAIPAFLSGELQAKDGVQNDNDWSHKSDGRIALCTARMAGIGQLVDIAGTLEWLACITSSCSFLCALLSFALISGGAPSCVTH